MEEEYAIKLYNSGILEWKINRPNKRNAINFNVIAGLEHALNRAEQDNNVKAVVITGEGDRAFCSGGDLDQFHEIKTEPDAYEMLAKMGKNLYRLATLSKPTLALINGAAVGGGCEIATACDFRIAKKESKLGFIQGTLAITTGWGGATLLYEKLTPSMAFKILSEAKVYHAEHLKEIGFIHKVYPEINLGIAHVYLNDILKMNVHVLKSYKQALISKWQQTSLEQRMMNEIRQCAVLWEKAEHHQAVERFLSQ